MKLSASVLDIDCAAEVARISSRIVAVVAQEQRRRGAIIALSGGVDSSVCGALAVRALGADKVYGLMLPERDSKSSSQGLGQRVAEQLGIPFAVEDIAPTLEAIGCYRWRDEAMRRVFRGLRRRLEEQDRHLGGHRRPHQLLQADRAVARRPRARGAPADPGVPADRRGHQLQATHPQDGGVLPCRPAELRRHRNPEPSGIRPGLLRQERRRRGRHQAHCPPVQDPGLCTGQVPRPAGRGVLGHADHRHLQPAARAGRVLLFAAVRQDGHRSLGAQPWRPGGGTGRPISASTRRAANSSMPTSNRSGAPRATCMRVRR